NKTKPKKDYCLLKAIPGSFREPRNRRETYLGLTYKGDGYYSYFPNEEPIPRMTAPKFPKKRLTGGGTEKKPGNVPSDYPEIRLLKVFMGWMNNPDRLIPNKHVVARMFCDLFDRRHWRLIEAKVGVSREIIREAVGQLLDYKRHFPRKPSMGVLVDRKP